MTRTTITSRSTPSRITRALSSVLLAIAVAACGGTTADATVARTQRAPESAQVTGRLDAMGRAATTTYAAQVAATASAFVAAVDSLAGAVDAGDTAAARIDELDAQAGFDGLRVLDRADPVNGAAVDQLATDVVPGESYAGLHAVEGDLWIGGPTAADVASLIPQASVTRDLAIRLRLGPAAIATAAIEELDWAVDVALPESQERASHLGLVDVAATVDAARQAFDTIAPLARQVAPGLTASVTDRFDALATAVAALGQPRTTPDTVVAPAARLTASRQLDATATTLARLAGHLVPFGTRGMPT